MPSDFLTMERHDADGRLPGDAFARLRSAELDVLQIDGVFAPQDAPTGYLAHLGLDLTLRATALAANVQQINTLRPQVVVMEQTRPDAPRRRLLYLQLVMMAGK